jgi:Arc/MetJ-type ribon-helix-helix transcriptional regulator
VVYCGEQNEAVRTVRQQGETDLKTIEVQLPDRVTTELDTLVKSGWFDSEDEIIRMALLEFVHRNRFALLEQFQREDIAWARQQRPSGPIKEGANP